MDTGINRNNQESSSVLAALRGVVPTRSVTITEALRIAELQAARLRELTGSEDDALAEETIADLPRIRIVRRKLPTSGMSYWNGKEWVIALNASEPEARQRFTLLHEYKHVIDHGRTERLYRGTGRVTADREAEHAADYFAACALMPKRLVKRAWGLGVQTPEQVADLFQVSTRAAEVRLSLLGLTEPVERCERPAAAGSRQPRRYFRLSTWRVKEWQPA